MSGDLETIPISRLSVSYYLTYANLPTTGVRTGELAYTTDRRVLYRWSGSAWQAITISSSSGTAANIPNAATLPDGSIYYETDTTSTKQTQAGVWVIINTLPSAISSSGTYAGDSTVNRAIPHGLGAIPKFVFIRNITDTSMEQRIIGGTDRIYIADWATPGGGDLSVTVADSTNFYVGNAINYNNSANLTGRNMLWVAIR